MYTFFYLNKPTFNYENLKNENNLRNVVNTWKNRCYAINLDKKDITDIFLKLSANKNTKPSTLNSLKTLLKCFRGANIIKDQEINLTSEYDKLIEISNKQYFSFGLFEDKSITKLFVKEDTVQKYDDMLCPENFEEFDKINKPPLRSITNFDRYENFNPTEKIFKKGENVESLFINYIFPIFLTSKKIKILDKQCLVDLLQNNQKAVTGTELFFKYVLNSNVNEVDLISGVQEENAKNARSNRIKGKINFCQNQKKYKNTEPIFADMIWDEFKERVIDKYFINIPKERYLIINLYISEARYMKELDRPILFDSHTAIEFHGLASLSSYDSLLGKSRTCTRYENLDEQVTAYETAKKAALERNILYKKIKISNSEIKVI